MLMQEEAEVEKAINEKLGHSAVARHSVSRLLPLTQKEQASEARRSFQKIECELMSEL